MDFDCRSNDCLGDLIDSHQSTLGARAVKRRVAENAEGLSAAPLCDLSVSAFPIPVSPCSRPMRRTHGWHLEQLAEVQHIRAVAESIGFNADLV
jgi:hypothetical protein